MPPSAYLASAATALGAGVQPAAVRFPESDGWPVIVMARGARVEGGPPPRIVNVYLDPPTARVLDVVDFRSSLFGFLHRFHENLTIPEYSGRAIVGWAGVGMLILSLTGIWLWWPRIGRVPAGPALGPRRLYDDQPASSASDSGFRFRSRSCRSPASISAFRRPRASLMSSIAPMTPQGQRPGFGPIARDARLTPDSALAAALASQPETRRGRHIPANRDVRTRPSVIARGAARAQGSRTPERRSGLARATAQGADERDRHRHGR